MKIEGIEVELPSDSWAARAIVKRIYRNPSPRQCAYQIHYLQTGERTERGEVLRYWDNSGGGCGSYCLFLGRFESCGDRYDLYHYPWYENRLSHYSTGIVFGHDPGNYMSGWPELAGLPHHAGDYYPELMKREVECGLIIEPDVLVAMAFANLRVDRPSWTNIMRWSLRQHSKPDLFNDRNEGDLLAKYNCVASLRATRELERSMAQ